MKMTSKLIKFGLPVLAVGALAITLPLALTSCSNNNGLNNGASAADTTKNGVLEIPKSELTENPTSYFIKNPNKDNVGTTNSVDASNWDKIVKGFTQEQLEDDLEENAGYQADIINKINDASTWKESTKYKKPNDASWNQLYFRQFVATDVGKVRIKDDKLSFIWEVSSITQLSHDQKTIDAQISHNSFWTFSDVDVVPQTMTNDKSTIGAWTIANGTVSYESDYSNGINSTSLIPEYGCYINSELPFKLDLKVKTSEPVTIANIIDSNGSNNDNSDNSKDLSYSTVSYNFQSYKIKEVNYPIVSDKVEKVVKSNAIDSKSLSTNPFFSLDYNNPLVLNDTKLDEAKSSQNLAKIKFGTIQSIQKDAYNLKSTVVDTPTNNTPSKPSGSETTNPVEKPSDTANHESSNNKPDSSSNKPSDNNPSTVVKPDEHPTNTGDSTNTPTEHKPDSSETSKPEENKPSNSVKPEEKPNTSDDSNNHHSEPSKPTTPVVKPTEGTTPNTTPNNTHESTNNKVDGNKESN